MIYLESFSFPDADAEYVFFLGQKRTCYDSFYPFQILPRHHLTQLIFEPITILYGGNGTGKSTVLNVIAEKLGLQRDSRFNRSSFYEDYLALCSKQDCGQIPAGSRIVTRIYDLDEDPVEVKRWSQLESVRAYYEFFKRHEGEF